MVKLVQLNYQDHCMVYQDDGWFNATQAASKFGKVPYEWQRLPETASYISGLERKYGKIPYLKTKRGNSGGTWLHPKLAVMFARWLDVDFAIWCDEQIDNIIRGKEVWTKERSLSKASYMLQSECIETVRFEAGKETHDVHYMNEAKLVNWSIAGKFESLPRDNLDDQWLKLVTKVQTKNSMMIAAGLTYEQRKPLLSKFANLQKSKLNLQLN